MEPTAVELHKIDDAAHPAAVVATWLLADLTDLPGVNVQVDSHTRLRLMVGSSDASLLTAQVAALMNETRFAGWVLAT